MFCFFFFFSFFLLLAGEGWNLGSRIGEGGFDPGPLDPGVSASVLFQKVQTFGNVMFV